MNKYIELKKEIEKRYNDFPFIFIFAFSDRDFEEKLKSYNVTKKEIISIGAGGFVRKKDVPSLIALDKWAKNAQAEAIKADADGSGFVKDMFLYEMQNHEYCITCDLTDTFRALNLKREEVQKDEKLKRGLNLALKEYKINN